MKLLLLAVAALALPAATAAAPAKTAVPVQETAAGWTFGRPGAPLLAEYASFGCPHCGEYAAASAERIERLVRAGKLRFAFRPFLIFPHDRAATVLARCVAPQRRLGFIKAALRDQAATKARLAAADADEALRGRLFAAELAGPTAYSQALAEVGGLTELARAHGLTAAAAQSCLASEANQQWVTDADLASRLSGVTGTPTFFWKGQRYRPENPDQLVAALPR